MRKNLFITLAVLTGMAISMTACLLGDVEALQKKALETNFVTVNIAEIQGVTVPATGGIPVRNIVGNDQYTGTVTWSPSPGKSGFTFHEKYTATITLTPKKGYTLHLVKANFFIVAGAESVSNAANSGIVTAVFTETKKNTVSISIIAPVKGATPTVTAISSDESGSKFSIGPVSWSPSHNPFLGGMVYAASVTLTANDGYPFTGMSSANINGQEASVLNNTGSTVTLSYTFPETDIKTVTSIAIKTQSANLTYTHGDTLNLAGLVVTLTHDDNTTEDVASAGFAAKNITATPAQGNNLVHSMHDGQPVKITYGNLTVNTSNLTVNKATPTAADFNVSGTGTFTYDGNSMAVTVTPKDGTTTGSITVKYNGSTTEPSTDGIYTVTFDVAETTNFNSASGLSAGILTIEVIFCYLNDLDYYLRYNPANTADTPYTVALNVNDLGSGYYYDSLAYILYQNPTKYVNLDLSGSTITSIEPSTFRDCTNLTSVTIPDSVTSIGVQSFSGCTSLTAINVNSTNINYSSDQGVLYNKNKTTLIKNPEGKKDSSFTIPNGVTTIGDFAFTRCTSLTRITIPDSVTTIERGAFYLSSLTSVTIPNGVTSIGSSAFQVCYSLTSVTIPESVTSIGSDAFGGCTSLTSVTIPDSVTSIGWYTFNGCSSLTSVTIPNSITRIEGSAFSSCTSLNSVTFEGTISSNNFYDSAFGTNNYGYIGDLRTKYLAGGKGTYTRASDGMVWTKQP